ncbi:hypothetical protein [Nakamurella sp.]|uniref:hypothetical protein n=1 Tax=Nakamurella sp. TaxID=1869182 RepID=UPI0037848746
MTVAPRIGAVDLTVVGADLILRFDLGAHRPVPVELSDVVAGGGGTVTADRTRWVARFPLAPGWAPAHDSPHPGAEPVHPPGVVLGVG